MWFGRWGLFTGASELARTPPPRGRPASGFPGTCIELTRTRSQLAIKRGVGPALRDRPDTAGPYGDKPSHELRGEEASGRSSGYAGCVRKRGKILATKWGVNPNSSSLGVDVTFLLFGAAALAVTAPFVSAMLRFRRTADEAAGADLPHSAKSRTESDASEA